MLADSRSDDVHRLGQRALHPAFAHLPRGKAHLCHMERVPVAAWKPATAAQDAVPRHWTDRCFRHLWWRLWGDLYGVSGWLLVLPVVVLGMLSAWLGWRGLLRASDSPTQG